jgi:hypothetical protein
LKESISSPNFSLKGLDSLSRKETIEKDDELSNPFYVETMKLTITDPETDRHYFSKDVDDDAIKFEDEIMNEQTKES